MKEKKVLLNVGELDGSITVEASIIMPFILIVLSTLLLASLLIHDIYVIRTDNTMKADAYAIAGENSRDGVGVMTFIIKPVTKTSGIKKRGYSVKKSSVKQVVQGSVFLVGLLV